MKKAPIFAGYINLKPINGIIFPSYAQNQINKEYINNNLNGEFFMSTNENTYGKIILCLDHYWKKKALKVYVCYLFILYQILKNKEKKFINYY